MPAGVRLASVTSPPVAKVQSSLSLPSKPVLMEGAFILSYVVRLQPITDPCLSSLSWVPQPTPPPIHVPNWFSGKRLLGALTGNMFDLHDIPYSHVNDICILSRVTKHRFLMGPDRYHKSGSCLAANTNRRRLHFAGQWLRIPVPPCAPCVVHHVRVPPTKTEPEAAEHFPCWFRVSSRVKRQYCRQ